MRESTLTRLSQFLVLGALSTVLFIAACAATHPLLRLFNGAGTQMSMFLGFTVTTAVIHLARRYIWKRDDPKWTLSLALVAIPAALWSGPLWHSLVKPALRFQMSDITDFPEVLAAWMLICLWMFLTASGRSHGGFHDDHGDYRGHH